MRVRRVERVSLLTYGPNKLFDVTDRVVELSSPIASGALLLQALGSTGALIVLPRERRLLDLFERDLWELVPTLGWRHPGNAYAHIRSTLIGVWLALPVEDGRPLLGDGNGVFFLENQPAMNRRRTIIAALVDEGA